MTEIIKKMASEHFTMDVEHLPYDMWCQVPEDYKPNAEYLDATIAINDDGDVSGAWVDKIELKINNASSKILAGILYEYQQGLDRDFVEGNA